VCAYRIDSHAAALRHQIAAEARALAALYQD